MPNGVQRITIDPRRDRVLGLGVRFSLWVSLSSGVRPNRSPGAPAVQSVGLCRAGPGLAGVTGRSRGNANVRHITLPPMQGGALAR